MAHFDELHCILDFVFITIDPVGYAEFWKEELNFFGRGFRGV